MGNPVKPSEFKSRLIGGSDRVCDSFGKGMQFMAKFYEFYNWAWKENGELSDAFRIMLNGGTNPDVSAAPMTPITFDATGNPGYIKLTWKMPTGSDTASFYRVYRSEDNDATTAVQISDPDPTSMSYTDSYNSSSNALVAGQTYYYWVEAVNSIGSSAKSSFASAEFQAPIADSAEIPNGQLDKTFDVGGTLTIYAWGGGAGGGDAGGEFRQGWVYTVGQVPPSYGGGGGGGGGAAWITMTITAGARYLFSVGAGGSNNSAGEDSWVKAYDAVAGEFKSTTTVSGKGGAAGNAAQSSGGIGGVGGSGTYNTSEGSGGSAKGSTGGNGSSRTTQFAQLANGGSGGYSGALVIDTVTERHGNGGAGAAGNMGAVGTNGEPGYIRYVYTPTA